MSKDREPPRNIDAEKSVLGSVLIKPSSLDGIADLHVDDLFQPAHRDIYEAMLAIAKRGRPVEIIEVADELKTHGLLARLEGGQSYLNDLANVTPTAENVLHYARIVREKATLRRLIAVCAEIQSSAYGDFGDVEEFLAAARIKIAKIEISGGGRPTLLREELERTLESIEQRAMAPDSYFIRTNIGDFNDKVFGLRGGNLIVIAGRPGQGKSAAAKDFLLHAGRLEIPGLLFSFEMTKMEVTERLLTDAAEVNGRKVISGKLAGPEWVRVENAAVALAPLPIWFETREINASEICAVSRHWFAQQPVVMRDNKASARKLGLIVVDYAGIVKSSGEEETREREIAALSGALKKLASELDIPVILVSQLNRESEKANRKPKLSDLRESGSIEQDANMVIFPYWEGTPPAEGRHPAEFIIAKNRSGPVGIVNVDWQPQFVRFVDKEEYEPPVPRQQDLLP